MEMQITNILYDLKDKGEEKVRQYLSLFSCPINPAIENFIRNRAINFAPEVINNVSSE
ncbi:MAG: hypothetical protein IJU48_02245 [Synergistaceae bacterium]|nr:hypothetical protein [Synergistaceae bacterium]